MSPPDAAYRRGATTGRDALHRAGASAPRERGRLLPASPGLLSPEVHRVGRRLVTLGVGALLLSLAATFVLTLTVSQDVRSWPVFSVNMVLLLVIAVVVARHDWEAATLAGRAHVHAEVWALAMVVAVTLNLSLAIPRPGSWLYLLIIATFFAVLLPTPGAFRVAAMSLAGAVAVEFAAGADRVVVVTAAIVIATVALVAHGIGDMVARVLADARRRAGLIATVAESAEIVSTLDPTEVPERVADAAMQLDFDVVAITERVGDGHRMLVERSRVGPVFDDTTFPLGTMIRQVVRSRRQIARDHYLSSPSPNPRLEQKGIDACVVSPVLVDDEVVALFVGGVRASELDRSQLEAFTLLGRLLSQALGNARRFERERQAVATLDELGRLKDDFLSNVSHELRTPITVILGGLQTIERHGDRLDEATRADLMRRAVANAESLQSTLGALLEFARIERGALDAVLDVVDLARLTQGSVDRLSSVLAQHEVEVETDGPGHVRAAPGQLDRVVDNLLVNVARHTPAGTRLRVEVGVAVNLVRLVVVDDGPGIAPEDVPRLTDRFFRGGASTTRETRGLGLGLALSQRILEAHGSGLQVWSEPGLGSRFSFELPRVDLDG